MKDDGAKFVLLLDVNVREEHILTIYNFRMQVTVPHNTVIIQEDDNMNRFFKLAIFEPKFYLYKYLSNLVPVILPAYTTYDDGTECSETSAHKVQTSGSPKRNNITFRTRRRFEIKMCTLHYVA